MLVLYALPSFIYFNLICFFSKKTGCLTYNNIVDLFFDFFTFFLLTYLMLITNFPSFDDEVCSGPPPETKRSLLFGGGLFRFLGLP